MSLSPVHQRLLIDLARRVICDALAGNEFAAPGIDDPVLDLPGGCFVTLHEAATHRLRGCVGRMHGPGPLIQTLCETARLVLQDPRFTGSRVTAGDLPALQIEVSILSPLLAAAGPLDFEPLTDGIYLIHAGRSGTFLPQVARETGWTRQQLLSRLCTEKMGLTPDAWRDPQARLLKYQVLLIGPEPFAVDVQAPRNGRVPCLDGR